MTTEIQTPQTDGNPSHDGSVYIESENFFDNLSGKIDGVNVKSNPIPDGIIGDNVAPSQQKEEVTKPVASDEKISALESKITELENVSKRYSDSSREGVRLAEENRQLQRELDGLKNPQPKDVFELLGIEKETFVFDADEAVKNPKSDSSRVLRAQQTLEVYRQREEMKEELRKEILGGIQEKEAAQQEVKFRKEFGYTDESKWEQFKEFTKNTPYDLKAAHVLFTTKDRDENVLKSVLSEIQTRKQRLNNIPSTLSNVNSNGLLDTSGELDLEKILGGGRMSTNYFK